MHTPEHDQAATTPATSATYERPKAAALVAPPVVATDAVLSPDGVYRYALMRRWAQGHPLRFVMLNPSTADATLDDPTIRRCMGFARREGFAALIVVNLYAYRSTDPKALLTCGDAVGPRNDEILAAHLWSALTGGNPVVAAWGANAKPDRAERVLRMVPGVDWRCLGTTKSGAPKHPLYIKGDQPLVPFGQQAGRSEPRPYSDEFYAAIDAQDFELALSIRDRDRQAERSSLAGETP